MKNKTARNITLIAIFTALTVICAQLVIPAPLPVTLQLFALFLALLFLGAKMGLITVVIYVLTGILGIPVFAGFNSGLGAIFCPTGGFILGFVVMAVTCFCGEIILGKGRGVKILSLVAGLILCYITGIIWFYSYMGEDSAKVILTGIVPLLFIDILKLIMAVFVSKRLKTAFKKLDINN